MNLRLLGERMEEDWNQRARENSLKYIDGRASTKRDFERLAKLDVKKLLYGLEIPVSISRT